MNNLSLEEKIGQMIVYGINEENVSERLCFMIKNYKIGGVILFKRNYKTYEDLINLVNELKQANKDNKLPLFISIDQEGGRVNRMPVEFENIKSPAELIQNKNFQNIIDGANITSKMLNACGVNMVYAPVLDIQRFADNHAIGDRCYGKTAKEVSENGVVAMKELQKNNIISVVKHFPGHGATALDSHLFLPTISKSIGELEKDDMKPFEIAIQEGAEAIMVGHLLVKGINNYLPASLSRKVILKYLRKKLKFKGLIITDDLKMKAVYFMYGANLALKKAFEAGNDIILTGVKESETIAAMQNIKKMVEKNVIKEARINRSVKRIVSMKEKYGISNESIDKINDEKINDINNMIFELNKNVLINK